MKNNRARQRIECIIYLLYTSGHIYQEDGDATRYVYIKGDVGDPKNGEENSYIQEMQVEYQS